ncbi:MAG TPA: RIP metalloprotease RseP [Oceanospirillales bacterium]|nr:RIP metalloprotease RseP [Oceanospirillales bacterium]|tara:strand:+ start:491 stop:1843 length:1353 start_codon:yes stop_codon:yes gene_type:complete
MSTLLSFILAISILVVIHEFGHFWVARRCGVKVLRFSVGFGKPLWSYTDKLGTEYSIAPIPLGGYVKMLDEREGPVKPEELHQAFNQKNVWQRIAIASAGPIANFIFAVVAYCALFMMGISGVVPVIGEVLDDSPAYEQGLQSGDRIHRISGKEVNSFQEVSWELISYIGETVDIELTVVDSNNQSRDVTIPVQQWLTQQEAPDPMKALGIEPRRLVLEPIVGEVVAGGAAAQAGLMKGDIILSANAESVTNWNQWVELVRATPLKPMILFIERNGESLEFEVIPAEKEIEDSTTIGFVGVGLHPDAIPEMPKEWMTEVSLGPIDALVQGVAKTQQLIVFTLDSLWKMILGDVSVKNLSGPITIAKVADSSVSNGIQAFISFLALLSVSLGVLNLLPIPVLDGGHILFYAIEAVRGKALSESTQIFAIKIGMTLLLGLMVIAFYNDISRL